MPYKDPEKAREYNRKKKLEYYHKNPKKFNSSRKKYKRSKVSKEKQKQYSKKYYEKNKEKVTLYSKKYVEKNRGVLNEKARARNRKNDPTIRIYDALRDFTRGDIGYLEYCRRVQQVIDGVDEDFSERAGRR